MEGNDEQAYGIEISDKSISVGWIRERANKNEFQLTGHAHKERQEETIKAKEIRDALMKGEILENYPDDSRGAGLSGIGIFGRQGNSYCLWSDEM